MNFALIFDWLPRIRAKYTLELAYLPRVEFPSHRYTFSPGMNFRQVLASAEGREDQTGGPTDPFKLTLTHRVVRWAGQRTRKATPATVLVLAA